MITHHDLTISSYYNYQDIYGGDLSTAFQMPAVGYRLGQSAKVNNLAQISEPPNYQYYNIPKMYQIIYQ